MNFKEMESAQKLGGVYYTPPTITKFLAQWVSGIAPRRILEPSCGDGAFLEALANLDDGRSGTRVVAVDVDPEALSTVRSKSGHRQIHQFDTELIESDFLAYSQAAIEHGEHFDAVIGNPPFIRYQYLERQYQELTEIIFEEAGLKFTRHTNAWVPFVLQGIRLLRPGGRLGMVIPAEIMHVLHAHSLREYLLNSCDEVALVHLEDLFSADVLQGVVLLLCSKKKKQNDRLAMIAFSNASNSDLMNGHAVNFLDTLPFIPSDRLSYKWMEGLLTPREISVYDKARSLSTVHQFSEIASADVGIVTGANKFFLVTDEVVEKYELHEFVHPMFGRSSHVRGVRFKKVDIEKNRTLELPTNFVLFPSVEKECLGRGPKLYLEFGEQQDLHTRYKCRIRTPWYVVPSVWAADVAMLKRAHNVPRLILNEASAFTTDTAYRITMQTGYKTHKSRLVWNFLNSLTALSAELEGRHYGGGVLELVPSEIERLLVPLVPGGDRELTVLDTTFREGKPIEEILSQQDARILSAAGLDEDEQKIIHSAWLRLRHRRQRSKA